MASHTPSPPRRRSPPGVLVGLLVALMASFLPGGLVGASGASAATCPCSIWSGTTTPGDGRRTPTGPPVEVGVKFRSDVAGQITGIRFYKGSGNTGTHVGHLWTQHGHQPGDRDLPGETTTGWQQATFAAPITITANTTYVASYYAPSGHYAVDGGYFATKGVDNGSLHALQDGVDGAQRPLPVRQRRRVPHEHLPVVQLLGGRRLHRRPPRTRRRRR